eukprot:6679770-Ditylum_brightwellii.AAC.1
MTAKDNTLDDLGNEFKDILNLNAQILHTILLLTSDKQIEDGSERLDDWRYSGDPLKIPEDIFNDGIDYTLNTYADVIYLNDQILK